VPDIDFREVLVLVMAAGVNYNGIWAGPRRRPVSPFDIHKQDSILPALNARKSSPWAVGRKVTRVKGPATKVVILQPG